MYLCKNMTDTGLPGHRTLLGGRDHSTIIHGAKKIEDEMCKMDKELRLQIRSHQEKDQPPINMYLWIVCECYVDIL